jgi:hypothetical protein
VRAAALDATVELAVSVLRCELGARLEDDANYAGLSLRRRSSSIGTWHLTG